jgi:NADH-quinone oxidoreductase subunit L
MVVGMAGIGWFLIRPHAAATINDKKLRQTGEVVLSAAPGPGYRYRWEGPGLPESKDFSAQREITVALQPGDQKSVVLQVKNAFNSVGTETFTLSRPVRKGGSASSGAGAAPGMIEVPAPGGIPTGTIPGDKIPDIIRGVRDRAAPTNANGVHQ